MERPSLYSLYLSQCKPRIGVMIVVSATIGFYLAKGSLHPIALWIYMVVGVLLTGAGSAALNNYVDKDADAKMDRTKRRAIPMGYLSPSSVLVFGILLVSLGVSLLYWQVNSLTGSLALATALLYVLVYTPLKRVTWLNTYVGAIPGALPAAGGWTAATGEIEAGAIILFALLFLWQLPHFYSIAWIYREDYKRGGFRMMPGEDPTGNQTFAEVMISSMLLIWVSLLPTFFGLTGDFYLGGALVLGYFFVSTSFFFVISKTPETARKLLRSSLLYLPLILILMVSDRVIL